MSAQEYSFTYNSIDFGGSSYNVHVVNRPYVVLPQPRIDQRRLAAMDGVATFGQTWGARNLTFECDVPASSRANSDTLMNNIAEKLKAGDLGEKPLVLGWNTGNTLNVRLMSGFVPSIYYAGFTFTLEFMAADPWFKADALTEESDAISGFTEINYSIGGDRDVRDAVWQIRNTGANLDGALSLWSTTTGEIWQYTGILDTDDWLRMTGATGAIEFSSAGGGPWQNVIGNSTGTVPYLLGGETNTIRVGNLTTGTLLLSYYARTF